LQPPSRCQAPRANHQQSDHKNEYQREEFVDHKQGKTCILWANRVLVHVGREDNKGKPKQEAHSPNRENGKGALQWPNRALGWIPGLILHRTPRSESLPALGNRPTLGLWYPIDHKDWMEHGLRDQDSPSSHYGKEDTTKR
jgi:hypothetical protein